MNWGNLVEMIFRTIGCRNLKVTWNYKDWFQVDFLGSLKAKNRAFPHNLIQKSIDYYPVGSASLFDAYLCFPDQAPSPVFSTCLQIVSPAVLNDLKQWFPPRGNFDPQKIFGIAQKIYSWLSQCAGANGIKWVGSRYIAKCPIIRHRTAPSNKELSGLKCQQ